MMRGQKYIKLSNKKFASMEYSRFILLRSISLGVY